MLQSPTTDHALVRQALAQLRAGGAHRDRRRDPDRPADARRAAQAERQGAARGDRAALRRRLDQRRRPARRRPAGEAQHVPIYTVVARQQQRDDPRLQERVTSSTSRSRPRPQQLQQIAQLSGGQSFTAADTSGLSAVYAHLGKQLGHKQVKHEITASFAGGALVLLLLGSVLSLRWFGRLV